MYNWKFKNSILYLLPFFIACINDPYKNNYGSVDLSLLTTLTWYPKNNKKEVAKFFLVLPPTDSTLWLWTGYFCTNEPCDTCYRYDTMKTSMSMEIRHDTVEYRNITDPPKTAKITKLNENELIMKYIDVYGDLFEYYIRNHKTLVTIETKTGTKRIDYHE